MLLATLLFLASAAEPPPALAEAFAGELRLTLGDDNGPPPGSPYPPPPPLVPDASQPPPDDEGPDLPPYPPRAAPPSPPSAADAGTRILWGIGLHFGGGQDQINALATPATSGGPGNLTSVFGGVGLYFRSGVQLNDRFGLDADLAAGTVIVESYARAALTVDVSPSDSYTLALGPVVRDDFVLQSCGCGGDVTVAVTSVGGTARFEIHEWVTRSAKGRSAVTFGLEADIGATTGANGFCNGSETYAGSGLAYAGFFTFGYSRY